ncbi:malate:quinone oxidoreductase [Citricoccus sp. SGAir0253]|uniref:malate:quinone oxidoreductase n=1 Tax=Citricoccus sp. SGAir0253 TaxID=2567881 RepID=UPI0010CCDFC3|nr:malate:quinone oxidoreductase [Citricoccus sp. SGAir0253]QCU78388.1 malate:quinone oxidoreductase [Citricoccus sp. SGAir0253]
MSQQSATTTYDVVLVGGGIMSATLGTLLRQLQPDWSIALYENLNQAGLEASDPWNNAGTGHAALCELNYSPMGPDGTVDPTKALAINEQFQVSRQFWSHLVTEGRLGDPKTFINPLPHMSFVWGDAHADYLRTRHASLSAQPLFETMEYTEDWDVIRDWAPLLVEGRTGSERLAASRQANGTDVDFGSLTRQLTTNLSNSGVDVCFGHKVTSLERGTDGRWEAKVKNKAAGETFTARARFVFLGAGGGSLHLLQSSGIPEAKGFGGFPVSGKFLKCTDETIVNQHMAKVYGQASVGAPPMSVPHLDTRFVDGRRSLLFGPYGGFSSNFLKSGSYLDLPLSVRTHNLLPMLNVAKDNLDLVKYLVTEVTKSQAKKVDTLQEFYPLADGGDWELITAGQRVQVMKKDPKKGGVLQFGTEVVTSADGTIGGLLGASPGASTAAPIMINLLQTCFPSRMDAWTPRLREMIPSLGRKLNEDRALMEEVERSTNAALKLA